MTYNELSVILNFPKKRLLDKLDKKAYLKMIECNEIMFKTSPEDFKNIINKCNDTVQMYFLMRAPSLFQYIDKPSKEVSILAICLDKNNIYYVKKEDKLLRQIAEQHHKMEIDLTENVKQQVDRVKSEMKEDA